VGDPGPNIYVRPKSKHIFDKRDVMLASDYISFTALNKHGNEPTKYLRKGAT
jgi:hypothetical protein